MEKKNVTPGQTPDGDPSSENQELIDEVRELVTIPRLEILNEDEARYRVRFGDKEYEITKGTESKFLSGGGGGGIGLSLAPSLTFRLGLSISQDENVPDEFKQVMIVHEIRELDYKSAGLEDTHERAMNDEILYVLKYFDQNQQLSYFAFASEYRANKLKREAKEKWRAEEKLLLAHGFEPSFWDDPDERYPIFGVPGDDLGVFGEINVRELVMKPRGEEPFDLTLELLHDLPEKAREKISREMDMIIVPGERRFRFKFEDDDLERAKKFVTIVVSEVKKNEPKSDS
jgi:hypothetical protein